MTGQNCAEGTEEEGDTQRRPGNDLRERGTFIGDRIEVLGGKDQAGGLGIDEEVEPLNVVPTIDPASTRLCSVVIPGPWAGCWVTGADIAEVFSLWVQKHGGYS